MLSFKKKSLLLFILTSFLISNSYSSNYVNTLSSINPDFWVMHPIKSCFNAHFETTFSVVTTPSASCVVSIPDISLKNYLVSNPNINTNGDSEIQCAEATAYTGKINVSGSVNNYTGLTSFVSIRQLFAFNGNLGDFDVSPFVHLERLHLYNCQINSIDVSANTKIRYMSLMNNNLDSINLLNNIELDTLMIDFNSISKLDLSQNDSLKVLFAGNNEIDELIFPNHQKNIRKLLLGNNQLENISFDQMDSLEIVFVSGNPLKKINTTNNSILKELYCANNQLKTVDISQNPELTHLDCSYNMIPWLDISIYPNIRYLECVQNPPLRYLNIANGNNTNFLWGAFLGNPNLSCIQVDNPVFADTTQLFGEDTSVVYSSSCPDCIVPIDDYIFQMYLVGDTNINTNGDAFIQCQEALAFTGVLKPNTNASLNSLGGIEYFKNITGINCQYTELMTADLSENTKLRYINFASTLLTKLNVKNNTLLDTLIISTSEIDSLDLSNNTQLSYFEGEGIFDDNFEYLNIANGNNTNITYYKTTNNPNLTCVTVDNVGWSNSNWTQKDTQTVFSTDCDNPYMGCIINIPDTNFKAVLLADTNINTNGDSEIQCVEAEIYTGAIALGYEDSISDLTGISSFVNLSEIDAYFTEDVSAIKLDSNKKLEKIDIHGGDLDSLILGEKPLLKHLRLYSGNLTNIDLSKAYILNYLSITDHPISSLNLSNCDSIKNLKISNTQIDSLDIRAQQMLYELSASENSFLSTVLFPDTNILHNVYLQSNSIDSLDINSLQSLSTLDLYNNQLQELDISSNSNLFLLFCEKNNLTSLDISNLPLLYTVNADTNNIQHFFSDSTNSNLNGLSLAANNLHSLVLKNGKNTSMSISTLDNPNLQCIEVDEPEFCRQNWHDIDSGVFIDTSCVVALCHIPIPDSNFKEVLLADTNINTNGDWEIQCVEASNFSGKISASFKNIDSLNGIEYFVNLTEIEVYNNQLSTIDFSNNIHLKNINVSDNQISNLKIHHPSKIVNFYAFINQLDSINLAEMDSLKRLVIYGNQLSNINLNQTPNLEFINCEFNQLSSLNFTLTPELNTLFAGHNQLTQIIPDSLYSLGNIKLTNNNFTNLNFDNFPNLYNIEANDNNQLSELSIKNGNNSNINGLKANNNPMLECIEVNDPSYFISSPNVSADAGVIFDTNCSVTMCHVPIPDTNFKAALVADTNINTNGDGEIQCIEASIFNGKIDVESKNIYSLEGIEFFPNITALDANHNQINSINLAVNTQLKELFLSFNQLDSINIAMNTELKIFEAQHNQLTKLDFYHPSKLDILSVNNNLLDTIDLSEMDSLTVLNLGYNNLNHINTSSMSNILDLFCYDNEISYLDLSSVPNLISLRSWNNQITQIDFDTMAYLAELNTFNNQLSSVELGKLPQLGNFNAKNNLFTELDFSSNVNLTEINVKNNSNLTALSIKNGNNIALYQLKANENPSLDCIEVDDVVYANNHGMWIKDSIAQYSENCACTDTTVNITVSACDSYQWGNHTITHTQTVIDTFPSELGCDSIVHLFATIYTDTTEVYTYTSCDSVTSTLGTTYYTSGTYTDSVYLGVDSCAIRILVNNITINNNFEKIDTVSACDSYTWIDGNIYSNDTNFITDFGSTIYGCDSVRGLYLSLNTNYNEVDTVTACDSYTWIDGNTYTTNDTTATYTYTTINGCDSTINLYLTILPTYHFVNTLEECDSFTWINGITYTSSTNDSIIFSTLNGCDSIYELQLTINNSFENTDSIQACNSFTWINGMTYFESNDSAEVLLVNEAGCDSIIRLNLTILNSSTYNDTIEACDSITWIDGISYSSDNYTATHTLTNSVGCDSIVSLFLDISQSSDSYEFVVKCPGEVFTWTNGMTYSSPGNYYDTLINSQGCDSIRLLDLSYDQFDHIYHVDTACDLYQWSVNGMYYDETDSNIIDTIFVLGSTCPQIHHLNLIINTSYQIYDTVNSCENQFIWQLTNDTLSVDTNLRALHYYPDSMLNNPNYCGTVHFLNLSFNDNTYTTDSHSSCDSFTWIDGNTYYSSNSVESDTFINSKGCDSVVTLDLTILESSHYYDTIIACNSFTWLDGITYTSDNNTATVTIANAQGCDSIIHLNLIVEAIDTGVVVEAKEIRSTALGVTYQWIDCSNDFSEIEGAEEEAFNPSQNGSYAVVVSNGICSDTSACVEVNNIGLEELSNWQKFSIIPNPAKNYLTIEASLKILNIEIYNSIGSLVYKEYIQDTTAEIDISNLDGGVYSVKITTNRGVLVSKFVKNK